MRPPTHVRAPLFGVPQGAPPKAPVAAFMRPPVDFSAHPSHVSRTPSACPVPHPPRGAISTRRWSYPA
eukprot:8801236-Pyramimonas_sp.AAC.1